MASRYFRRFGRACADSTALLDRRSALRDGVQAAMPGRLGSRSPHPDGGMAARADAIADVERRIGDALALIDEGLTVISGVGIALGERHANTLFLRYYEGLPWRTVAHESGMSERWCHQSEAVCFGYVDTVGVRGAIEGRPLP